MYLLWILKMDFHHSKLVLNQWFLTDWAISIALFPSSLTDSSACSNLLLKESNFSFQLSSFFSFYLVPFYNFYLFTSILNLFSSSFWFPLFLRPWFSSATWAYLSQLKSLSSIPNVWASSGMLSVIFFFSPVNELYFPVSLNTL